jgi:hypothetical protein
VFRVFKNDARKKTRRKGPEPFEALVGHCIKLRAICEVCSARISLSAQSFV